MNYRYMPIFQHSPFDKPRGQKVDRAFTKFLTNMCNDFINALKSSMDSDLHIVPTAFPCHAYTLAGSHYKAKKTVLLFQFGLEEHSDAFMLEDHHTLKFSKEYRKKWGLLFCDNAWLNDGPTRARNSMPIITLPKLRNRKRFKYSNRVSTDRYIWTSAAGQG